MPEVRHDELTGIDNHALWAFQYVDEAARLAATGFVPADVGKIAKQGDDKYFILLTIAPETWHDITGVASTTNFLYRNSTGQPGNITFDTGEAIANFAIDLSTQFSSTVTLNLKNVNASEGDVVYVTRKDAGEGNWIVANDTGGQLGSVKAGELGVFIHSGGNWKKVVIHKFFEDAGDLKVAYESNADTNAFTDNEQSKLSNLPTNVEENSTEGAKPLASVDQLLNTGQEALLSLSEAQMFPIVSAFKEVVSGPANSNDWNISPNEAGWSFNDHSHTGRGDTTVTPSGTAGTITLTMTGGSWAAADVGRRFIGNGGTAFITSVDGGTASATVVQGKDFTDISAITPGNWVLYSGYINDSGEFSLGNFVDFLSVHTTDFDESTNATFGQHQAKLDSSGKVHVVWSQRSDVSPSDKALHYATNASGSWVKEFNIATDSDEITYCSLAIDSLGKAHILYYEGASTYTTHHLTNASGSWVDETVRSGDAYMGGLQVTIDSSDKLHIAYTLYNVSNRTQVSYSTNASGSWVHDELLTDALYGDTYNGTYGIQLDSAGKVHILCKPNSQNTLLIMDNTSGSWAFTEIAGFGASYLHAPPYNGSGFSLDTSNNSYHIFWKQKGPANAIHNRPHYMTNTTGSWVVEENIGNFTTDCYYESSAFFDANHKLHVAVSNNGTVGTLDYVTNVSGGWVRVSDLTSGVRVYETSLVIDANSYITMITREYNGVVTLGMVTLGDMTSYVQDSYVACVSDTTQISTALWADIDAITVTESLGGEELYYAFSIDSRSTFQVADNTLGARNIVSNLNSVTGQTEGVWCYNTNADYASETWSTFTTNGVQGILEQAMTIAANRMDGTTVNAITDPTWPAVGTVLDIAMIAKSTSPLVTPVCEQVVVSYVASVVYDELVKGTDYSVSQLNDTQVAITGLVDNGNCFFRVRA